MPDRQRGQATPLVLVVVLFAALLSVGIVQVGAAAGRRANAQAAADAAALAGAADGPEAAARIAASNDAQVVSYIAEADDVVVIVERRGASATARARWLATPIP